MNDSVRRVNSIVVKNLPTDFNEKQLEELFSQFGKILSIKVLPNNPSFDGGCGFVNYADAESCKQAVENMNNFLINGFSLRVNHSTSRSAGFDRPIQSGFRTSLTPNINSDETNGISSSRHNGFRSASEQPIKFMSTNDVDKTTWNNNFNRQSAQIFNSKNLISNINIEEHEPFVKNKIYNVYLSNLEVPNVVFAATLDDYVNATLLITQMNKHEQLVKVQANSYKTKLVVGEICAAQFNNDWYRARVLEIGENRVRVQYIDWGNTGWCDSTLEIRPLPQEYLKDPVLCVKCILDGIPSNEKLSDEQKTSILNILVLDIKLELTVLHIENNIPYIRLNLGEKNLNNEIRTILLSSTLIKSNHNLNKLEINLNETYFVQLTTVDNESECFHVLIMHDCLTIIMNTLKDWNANKQPINIPPKINTLVCAQYDADDLWYRAWIKNINDKGGYQVYFVDFGNEEIVSIDRLSECPEILKNIPWQSIQIKLANITLTNDERYELLKELETERLEMKILQKNQDIYIVDLLNNNKSIVENLLELRKKQPPPPPQIKKEIPIENSHPITLPVQPTAANTTTTTSCDLAKKSQIDTVSNSIKSKNESTINENLTILITEQREQNRLLRQVIAAINTTNALLTQLVQR